MTHERLDEIIKIVEQCRYSNPDFEYQRALDDLMLCAEERLVLYGDPSWSWPMGVINAPKAPSGGEIKNTVE